MASKRDKGRDKNETKERRRYRSRFRGGVSLSDVAARAQVSTASVSRVLNNSGKVNDDIRERVERASRELGYLPNGAARALAARKTKTIGAIVPAIENSGISSSVAAFQRVLRQAGYTLLLTSTNYDMQNELQEAQVLLARGVDGLMFVGGEHHPEVMPLIERYKVPFIETWTLVPGRPSVGLDNFGAAKAIAQHLVGLRHRRFGLIMGQSEGNDRAALRLKGVRACLDECGLEKAQEWLIDRPYNISDAKMATHALLGSRNRPTAIICGNDQIAIGAMIQAAGEELIVPRDISIVGFNDLELAAHLNPPLTTMRVPFEDIGRISAELLLRSIDDKSFVPTPFEVPATLVVRGSTAVAPSHVPA